MTEIIHVIAVSQAEAVKSLGAILSAKGKPPYTIIAQEYCRQNVYFVGDNVSRSDNMADGPNPEILGPNYYSLIIKI